MLRVAHPSGHCFVCGENSLFGVNGIIRSREDNSAMCEFSFSVKHQGPPGTAHGGAIAAVLDDVMSFAMSKFFPAYLAKIEIKYRKPIMINQPCKIIAELKEKKGRKIWVNGKIMLPDETVAAESTGLYIQPKTPLQVSLKYDG